MSGITGRTFTDTERDEIKDALISAYRKTFIVYGMTNPGFVKIMGIISRPGQARIAEQVVSYR